MTSRRLARGLRTVSAAGTLAGLTVGYPAALLGLGADPRSLLPTTWPPAEEFLSWAWTELRWAWRTGELVLDLLLAAGWLAWLVLVYLIVTELAVQLRQGTMAVHRLPAVSARRWIAGLVASVILLGAATPANAAPGPAATVVATGPQRPDALPQAGFPTAPTATTAQPPPEPTTGLARCPRLTVVHGDTLWGLAETHLGDGRRYPEIVALNRPRLTAGADVLEPGWELAMPPDAVNLPDRSAAPCVEQRTVEVHPGDTLSSIAARELGDPDHWPALYAANYRHPQPDGRALLDPNLILPGWMLIIPTTPDRTTPNTPQDEQKRADNERVDPGATEQQGDHHGQPGDPHEPSRDAASTSPVPESDPRAAPDPHPGTGISVGTGAFVGLGLAALITAALMTVLLWRRRTYRPGSGLRDETPAAPVVRALRLAHDQATLPRDQDGELLSSAPAGAVPAEAATRARAHDTATAVLSAGNDTVLGIRDGQAIAVDLARTRGLGLAGPGAAAAARALVVNLLAANANADATAARVVIPADDIRSLLGEHDTVEHSPSRLRIVASLDHALNELETELLTRTRTGGPTAADRSPSTVVLVATPEAHAQQRLQAVLEHGAELGLATVLIGEWPPGGTVWLRADGTVETTSHNLIDMLAGTRLFTLPSADARDLLDLLGTADRTQEPSGTGAADPDQFEFLADPPDPATEHSARPDPAPTAPLPTVEVTVPESPAHPHAEHAPHTLGAPASNATDPGSDETAMRVSLCVLGRLHLYWCNGQDTTDLIDAIAPKQREILTYLALHSGGARSDAVTAAIWPDTRGRRPRNTFHVTVSQLRKGVRAATDDPPHDLIVVHDGYYTLNPDLVTVDLWHLRDALRSYRDASDEAHRHQALERVVDLNHGPLGADITAEWIEAPREALRREILDAISALIRLQGKGRDERKLALLELARGLDEYNEAIYRDIARTLARLGQPDAIPRTQKLLTDTLDEIDERPTRDTIALMQSLQRAAEPQPPAKPAQTQAAAKRKAAPTARSSE
ncbi:LysM peptidoglycan-binding domain-containing protein [Prauserella muralis]|uniref:Uncharacterized protein n=1 Tax=Prauserella muralis TaxID=588067 RepID=A0A2V4AXM9_9PSEU|nr:LysM peptidoglycan-binding domain-containing protein [Prauserella muralis]PXY25424.1 hypothetical protein BAY60_18795 [Prauserella muralis]TWE27538.1 DNA-binding SARP family transcriptional activator [Prauserella muralis]